MSTKVMSPIAVSEPTIKTTDLRLCVDVSLPEPVRAEAHKRAMQENKRNAVMSPFAEEGHAALGFGAPDGSLSIAAVTLKMWDVGRTLRVRFLNGD